MNTKNVIFNNQPKNIDKHLFNTVRFIVQRFELNDSFKPSYYIVGFKIVCDLNQREQYLETHVNFKDCNNKSDNEICSIAYSLLKEKIELVRSELIKENFIIGSEFVPPVE